MTDAVSVDSVKRRMLKVAKPTSLEYYYRQRFDPSPRGEGGGAAEGGGAVEETGNASFEEAQWMCMYSVAAYSLVQYILALKARHRTCTVTMSLHVLHVACCMCMCMCICMRLTPHSLAPQDRHNGNILVDSRGRMVHLGFSYVLGWAPGGMTFEKSAFKLTRDVFHEQLGDLEGLVADNFKRKVIEGIVIDDTPIFSKLLHEEQVGGDIAEI